MRSPCQSTPPPRDLNGLSANTARGCAAIARTAMCVTFRGGRQAGLPGASASLEARRSRLIGGKIPCGRIAGAPTVPKPHGVIETGSAQASCANSLASQMPTRRSACTPAAINPLDKHAIHAVHVDDMSGKRALPCVSATVCRPPAMSPGHGGVWRTPGGGPSCSAGCRALQRDMSTFRINPRGSQRSAAFTATRRISHGGCVAPAGRNP